MEKEGLQNCKLKEPGNIDLPKKILRRFEPLVFTWNSRIPANESGILFNDPTKLHPNSNIIRSKNLLTVNQTKNVCIIWYHQFSQMCSNHTWLCIQASPIKIILIKCLYWTLTVATDSRQPEFFVPELTQLIQRSQTDWLNSWRLKWTHTIFWQTHVECHRHFSTTPITNSTKLAHRRKIEWMFWNNVHRTEC